MQSNTDMSVFRQAAYDATLWLFKLLAVDRPCQSINAAECL